LQLNVFSLVKSLLFHHQYETKVSRVEKKLKFRE
jgi:hypothetical protein